MHAQCEARSGRLDAATLMTVARATAGRGLRRARVRASAAARQNLSAGDGGLRRALDALVEPSLTWGAPWRGCPWTC